jgi:phosphoribosylformylglycinamidine cyclo-ligase
MGIGMVLAVNEADAQKVIDILTECGEKASVIGRVIEGEGVTML